MSCYISSNNNRIYVALEGDYGEVGEITEQNRIPAVKFGARQAPDQTTRRDKSGSRTFLGLPNRIRRNTSFQLNTFMTQMPETGGPSHGPLFQAAMGSAPVEWAGGNVASVTDQTQVTFTAPHGLSVGQAVAFEGEIRFAGAVTSDTSVSLNAPFTNPPGSGAEMSRTVTFKLATDIGSASIFDYWDPGDAVHRIVNGAVMNRMSVKVNGDFHEFEFSGGSKDLIDSASFESGLGALTEFPTEPAQIAFDYTIVPGHLGQVWMGTAPSQFFTLTGAELTLENNAALRNREFGNDTARCIAAGQRLVKLDFSIFEDTDAQTKELYQAARQRSPIGVMLQLGEHAGQLFGAYLPAMVPEVPEYDDSETRLEWKFSNGQAQGFVDDELYIAFA